MMDTDEIKLMKRVKRGDKTAIAELIQRHEGYLRKMATSWFHRGRRFEMDDCFQEAALGLLWAVDRFDIDRGNTFLIFATWWIKKFLEEMRYTRTAIRVKRGAKSERLEADATKAFQTRSLKWPVVDKASSRSIEISDARDFVRVATRLDSQHRSVFRRRMDGETIREIAKSKGVTTQAVSKMDLNALSKVATEMYRLHRNGDRRPRTVEFELIMPPPPYVDYEFVPLLDVVTSKN